MRHPRTRRAEREMNAEARHNAVVLEGDDLSESAAWKDMNQPKLPLKDQPIKGENDYPPGDDSRRPPRTTPAPDATVNMGAARQGGQQEQPVEQVPMAVDVEDAAKSYGPLVQQFTDHTRALEAILKKDNITIMDTEIAIEYENPAIDYLKALEDPKTSKLRRWATSLHELHLQVTGRMAQLAKPAEDLRAICSRVYRTRDRQVIERQREAQRKADVEMAAKVKAEREAEIAQKEAEGATEEAAVLKDAPLPQVAAFVPPAPKIEGVAIVYSAGFGEITDPALFWKYIGEHPEMGGGFEPRMAFWKQMGTSHLNKQTGTMSIEIPGFRFAITNSARRTKE